LNFSYVLLLTSVDTPITTNYMVTTKGCQRLVEWMKSELCNQLGIPAYPGLPCLAGSSGNHPLCLCPQCSEPRDEPSRGIYPSKSLLLPPVSLHSDLIPFLIDCQSTLSPTEIRLLQEGAYSASATKVITSKLEEENLWQNLANQGFSENCQALDL